ncbi:CaiB/BaiF CoA transferase family protein [Streptomyces sp. NPDC051018]|uniref:CaiB/BaiF CoA transferase family protein n=1 Tax=Streptomyces sp. NPDC051018 TaxID=3365639 RepID=UPI00379379A7
MPGPLAHLKIIEFGGIGPGPFCGMVLSDLGAEVIRLERPADAGRAPSRPVLLRNRRSVAVDLKTPDGVETALRLVEGADAAFEGFRPGVAERLGIGPDTCLARNPRLVYGRMTGWGQEGPYAREAGHDINYIGLSGALAAVGPADGDPVVPLNMVGDFGGGGMLLALGITSALLHAQATGQGQVVDAAMTDGSAPLLATALNMMATGTWTDRRGSNTIDGAAPYYRAYRCADGRHMAVGCVEPQFYAHMLTVLGLARDPLFAAQEDRAAWPAMAERLEAVFAERTRDAWTAAFDGHNACVTPVLSLTEAPGHPHNLARGTYTSLPGGTTQPAPAPRFSATPAAPPRPAPKTGADTEEVLREAGITAVPGDGTL